MYIITGHVLETIYVSLNYDVLEKGRHLLTGKLCLSYNRMYLRLDFATHNTLCPTVYYLFIFDY